MTASPSVRLADRWDSQPALRSVPAVQVWRKASFPGFGTVLVGAAASGVLALELLESDSDAGLPPLVARLPESVGAPQGLAARNESLRHVERALAEVGEYLAGARKLFSVPIDLPGLPPFARRVLEETARIPWGCATTYGGLAGTIGCPGGARAVGQALGRNPVPLLVPCHRVLAGGGLLGGFSGGLHWKRHLLRIEGVGWKELRAG